MALKANRSPSSVSTTSMVPALLSRFTTQPLASRFLTTPATSWASIKEPRLGLCLIGTTFPSPIQPDDESTRSHGTPGTLTGIREQQLSFGFTFLKRCDEPTQMLNAPVEAGQITADLLVDLVQCVAVAACVMQRGCR